MDGRADRCMEFLPILQDFVPCRGHCPKKRNEHEIMGSQGVPRGNKGFQGVPKGPKGSQGVPRHLKCYFITNQAVLGVPKSFEGC